MPTISLLTNGFEVGSGYWRISYFGGAFGYCLGELLDGSYFVRHGGL